MTLDHEAARADLRGKIATNDGALAKVRDQLGALALDVTLGNAAQSELDAANAEHARLGSNGEALTRALAEVDKREAAQLEKDAAAKRKTDEAERERLMAVVQAASAKAADLVEKLATATAEACDADRRAAVVGARLGNQQKRSLVQFDLATLILAKLPELAPNLRAGYAPPAASEAAAARLRAV